MIYTQVEVSKHSYESLTKKLKSHIYHRKNGAHPTIRDRGAKLKFDSLFSGKHHKVLTPDVFRLDTNPHKLSSIKTL